MASHEESGEFVVMNAVSPLDKVEIQRANGLGSGGHVSFIGKTYNKVKDYLLGEED